VDVCSWAYRDVTCHTGNNHLPVPDTTQFNKGIDMRIYVGNLSYDVTQEELRKEFQAFGEVESVEIITDKYSGRPKGFGFIEMSKVSEGQAAITGLNGKTLQDRQLKVNEARPRSDNRGSRPSYGNNRGGGSYGDRRGGGFGGERRRRY
jgi:cold-inducible RNA-binding protein